ANINVASLILVPFFAAVAPGFDEGLESGSVGAQQFQICSFAGGHVGGDAERFDRHVLLGFVIKTHCGRSARQCREQFDALDDAAKQRDVSVELARGVADNDVQFCSAAAVGGDVAS